MLPFLGRCRTSRSNILCSSMCRMRSKQLRLRQSRVSLERSTCCVRLVTDPACLKCKVEGRLRIEDPWSSLLAERENLDRGYCHLRSAVAFGQRLQLVKCLSMSSRHRPQTGRASPSHLFSPYESALPLLPLGWMSY